MGNHAPKYLTLTSSQTLPPIGLCLTHYITAMPVFLLEHIKPFPVSGTLYTVLPLPQLSAWLAAHASTQMLPPKRVVPVRVCSSCGHSYSIALLYFYYS